jgi:hypothetical protein
VESLLESPAQYQIGLMRQNEYLPINTISECLVVPMMASDLSAMTKIHTSSWSRGVISGHQPKSFNRWLSDMMKALGYSLFCRELFEKLEHFFVPLQ